MYSCRDTNKNQHWEWDSETKLIHSNKGKCLSTESRSVAGTALKLSEWCVTVWVVRFAPVSC